MIGAEVYPVPAVAYENPLNYNHQARDYAKEQENSFWTNQFDNTANANVHYVTTGPEIWEQMQGKIDGFICSTGTGGTLAGVGKFLKEKSGGKTQIWLADPPGSVLTSYILSGGTLVERTGSSITEGMPQFIHWWKLSSRSSCDRCRAGPYHGQPCDIRQRIIWRFHCSRQQVNRHALRIARYRRTVCRCYLST